MTIYHTIVFGNRYQALRGLEKGADLFSQGRE
jgi:hypothetical protein